MVSESPILFAENDESSSSHTPLRPTQCIIIQNTFLTIPPVIDTSNQRHPVGEVLIGKFYISLYQKNSVGRPSFC